MAEYVFGTYLSYNQNIDSNRTADRYETKWRTQEPVSNYSADNSRVSGDPTPRVLANPAAAAPGDHFYLGNVFIVSISDIDYQLKKTDPVSDQYRIIRVQGNSLIPSANYLGRDPVTKFSVQLSEDTVSPTANNPNPNPFPEIALTPKPVVLPDIPFAEVRLELGYDYGAVGGPSFATTTVKVADERESRNSDRALPLHRFQLGDRMVADSERDLLQEVSYLKQFHAERKGSYEGFRYKDWADYAADNQYIATGDGIKTHFQLRKAYRVGNAVTYRPIQKPVFGTVDLFVDEVNVAVDRDHEWVVNHDTGVIEHPEPLPAGSVLTANFEFDVPVRFESDAIGFSLQAYEPETEDAIYRLESVYVAEVRLPLTLPWAIEPTQEITEALDLGIIYDTVEQYNYATERQDLQSGWGLAKANREDNKRILNLGGRNYARMELDKLLATFWNAKGNTVKFPLKNLGKKYQVFFNSLQLISKFEIQNAHGALYNLSGLKIEIEKLIDITLPVLPDFLVNITFFDVNAKLTPNSQTIEENSYSTYGGNSANGSSKGSGGGASNAVAVGYGSINNISFPAPDGFSSSEVFAATAISEIGGYPVFVGFLNNINTSRDPFEVAVAFTSDLQTGIFTVETIEDYLLLAYNNSFPYKFTYYDGVAGILVTAQKPAGDKFLLCIEFDSPTSYSYTATPIKGAGNYLSSPNFYVDDRYYHAFIFNSSFLRFDDFLSPGGKIVTENSLSFNIKYSSGARSNDKMYPAILSGDSNFEVGTDYKAYPNALKIDVVDNLVYLKQANASTNDFDTKLSFNARRASFINHRGFPDSKKPKRDLVVLYLYGCLDATFPHTNLDANDLTDDFIVIIRRSSDDWIPIGSWRYNDVPFSNPTYISGFNPILFNGLILNTFGYLIDTNTGAMFDLRDDSAFPSFPINTFTSVGAGENYLIAYGKSKLIYFNANVRAIDGAT